MSNHVHILGFSGSLRRDSFNSALLRTAQELLPEGVTLDIFEIAPLPIYNGDVEAQGFPAVVQRFRDHIVAADALLIASPEYNYGIPGGLKNAIDWASRPGGPEKFRPLGGKPLALMGASDGAMGTVRSQLQLRQVALHTNMLALNRPEVLVTNAVEKFDKEGHLTDVATRQHVSDLLVALAAWTRRLRGE